MQDSRTGGHLTRHAALMALSTASPDVLQGAIRNAAGLAMSRESTRRARARAAAERMRAKLPERTPEHVKHCYHNGARDWWVYTWPKANPRSVRRVPYHCKSWRCEECKKYDAAVNYARFTQACEPLDDRGWCFLTLTLQRDGEKKWQDVDAIYRELSDRCGKFFKRLRRWMVKQGWYDVEERVSPTTGKVRRQKVCRLRNTWIGVVEAHRSGWPHMHFIVWSPELARFLKNQKAEREAGDWREADYNLLPEELSVAAQECGWGERSELEPARNVEALNSYLMKLAGEAGELQGELAKMTQLPTVAPNRFRRLRSGKGFLPPREKNDEYTGTLLRRRMTAWGAHADPIHAVQENPIVQYCCRVEDELAGYHLNKQLPEQPVKSVSLPQRVLDSLNGNPGTDDCACGGHSAGGSAAPLVAEEKRDPVGGLDTPRKGNQWQERSETGKRRRAPPNSPLGGAPIVAPTLPGVSMSPTDSRNSRPPPAKCSGRRTLELGSSVVFVRPSPMRPTRLGDAGSS